MNIIEIKKLSKKFGSFTAVDSISLSVEEGEIFGLLGPNGAGKTTTLSMLATLTEPISGEAFINGFSIKTQKDEVRHSIGMVFQDPSLDEELTAYENMDFHARLYSIPKEKRKKRIADLLILVGLEDRKKDLVKTFSGGMKRRLELARGLLHEPKVLFLDEPTLGLDPQTRNHLWEYIEKLSKEKKVTIILTTHYMEEADKLCRRIAVIDQGKIIVLDKPSSLKGVIGADVVSLESNNSEHLAELLKNKPWLKNTKKHDGILTLMVIDGEKHITEIANIAHKHKIEITSMTLQKPTLEDVFLHFTGKTIREEEAKDVDRLRNRMRAWGRR